jgi:hypothetical protein
LNRAKWKVWHGNLYGASIALSSFYEGVDIQVMIAESDSGRSTIAKQVRERVVELWSYLTANQTRLINYGRQHCEGHRISTARVESTVDQLVDWRMEKKQQHALDPTRRADVAQRALCATQRRTGQIHRVVALRIIADPGRGGMNPQVLSGPHFPPVSKVKELREILHGSQGPVFVHCGMGQRACSFSFAASGIDVDSIFEQAGELGFSVQDEKLKAFLKSL